MKATYILKRNIEALLKARHLTQHDLAVWCRRSDAWISKILSENSNPKGERGVPLRDLDRIADFFGLSAYQLFQPGISPLTERRKGVDRRSGKDRRVSAMNHQVRESVSATIASLTAEDVADLIRLRTLDAESRATVRTEIHALERSARQNAAPKRGRRPADTPLVEAAGPPERAAPRRRAAGSDS